MSREGKNFSSDKEGEDALVSSVSIVDLSPDDWRQLRDLKLKSLKEEPIAFEEPGAGRKKYLERSEEEWRAILEGKMSGEREGETVSVFARSEEELVGMVSAIIAAEQDADTKSAKVQHMYVAQDGRGQGTGAQLFNALLERLQTRSDIKKVVLEVVDSQVPAIEMYKKFGFKETGREEPFEDSGGNDYEIVEMELRL